MAKKATTRKKVKKMKVKDAVFSVISDYLFLRKFGTYEECEKAVYLFPDDVIDYLAFLDSQGESNAADVAESYSDFLN